jgi:hypothetical protein
VPLELQVEYCNKTQCDGWFCFFQAADDDYITQYATYVRDNLNANLTAHFELSNEVWNTLFNANAYFLNEGRTAWPGASGVGDLEVALNAQGKRAAEVAILVNAVYAGQESRRVNVLGGIFDDFVAWNEYIAIATTWQAQDPGGYVRPSSVCQAFAYAPYYGFALSTSEAANVAAAYAAGTHIEFIDDYLNNPSTGVIPNLIPSFALQKAFCDSEGLAMLQYEGGRHYLHGGVQGDALTAMLEYSRTENDAANILQMWNAWEEVGDGPMQVYWDVGVHGPFGVFSYAAYYGDTSPYSEILFTLNEYTPNWWGGTGDYRQAPITGATDYRIPTGDSKPLTTESYFHVFGNSTFTYDGGSPAPATSYTRAGEWLGLLAGASSRKSVGSYTFGFYDTWNAYNWGSPASGVQISGNYSIGNTEPWTGDITNSNYTDFINMPSNFFGDEMGQQPFNSPVTTVVTRINNLIDNINSVHADVNHILYAHWADAGPYSVASTNTRADFTIYNNSQLGDYLDWFIEAQDAVIAGGRPMRMFPVGAIIAWLFENESYLQSLNFYDVYGDDAPHGSENIYLLVAMICYRCIYGSGPDLAAFTIPPAATQIRSEISNNLPAIDAAIRDRLIFHRANGVNV